MKLKQVNIALENAHGRLFEVTNALGEAGINIRASTLVDTGAFGQLRLIVSDLAETRRILMEKTMPAQVVDVVAVELEDKPGALADALKCLLDTQINVIYSYAFIEFSAEKAVNVFRFNDNDAAIEILKEKGFKLLSAEDFGIKN